MRNTALLIIATTFLAAAGLCLLTARFSVILIERNSEIGVRAALDRESLTWAEVQANGLQVILSGTAPSEAIRFQAQSVAGSVVDAARVIDQMDVQAVAEIAPPRFSIEILRNDSGISVAGLIPHETDREALGRRFAALVGAENVADLTESARYDTPQGWEEALAYAIEALAQLERSKLSVQPGRVTVTAISDSAEEKARLERSLARAAPSGVAFTLDIAAPRPVITPFTLRFVIDEAGPRFDACSADTEDASAQILRAAQTAGASEISECVVGMGVPSPQWANAAELAISALAELGQGSVTFSDADISLLAAQGTESALFDRVVGELEAALPEVFAVHAVLPPPVDDSAEGPPEFTATLSPEGQVQLRGRVSDENLREVVNSFAQANFGAANVYTAARVAGDLPVDWPLRVLTGLEALSMLSNGSVRVEPDTMEVRGNTGNAEANAQITQLLADKLGAAAEYTLDVMYLEKLDPVAGLPTPEECEAEIAAIVAARKIVFAPGETVVDSSASGPLDDIAEILKLCEGIQIEIQGHTDSQGREEMNQQLSQARAQSVLSELRSRRVLTTNFVARGYGETQPIADNDTEEGREANRRIAFRLIRPAPTEAETPHGLDEAASETSEAEAAAPTGEDEE